MKESSVRVLVVDDQAPFRDAAIRVVGATSGFEVVGQAESGEEAVLLAGELSPDLVLMDVNLPGMDGIEAVRRIRSAHPDVTAFLLSTYRAADLPSGARSCGAAGYIHKEDFGPEILASMWSAGGDPAWPAP